MDMIYSKLEELLKYFLVVSLIGVIQTISDRNVP